LCGRKQSFAEFTLATGTVLMVVTNQRVRRVAFDGETVLVKYDGRTFCIPDGLLEAVPTEQALNHEPKESAGDAQGDRVA
jgi:hypothetical protein